MRPDTSESEHGFSNLATGATLDERRLRDMTLAQLFVVEERAIAIADRGRYLAVRDELRERGVTAPEDARLLGKPRRARRERRRRDYARERQLDA